MKYRPLFYLIVGVSLLAAAGCQKTVYLMPTPALMTTGELNPFNINPDLEESNCIDVLYASNRMPLGDAANRTYTIFPGDDLRMGIARFTIGDRETEWERIFRLSTSGESKGRPPLHLVDLEELAVVPLGDETDPIPRKFKAFAATINDLLSRSIGKDIMVYVHGANSTIYRAAAQAAQYRHFTGRNCIVLAFLWPSAENLLSYGKDVRHAKNSAPAFRRLIALLAEYTHAENINILAYSAGAQIASPGLGLLGRETKGENRGKLRLGEIYFAAGDEGIDSFVENVKTYLDLPRSVTFTINLKDRVLALAESQHGISRLGRPKEKDLSPDDVHWARRASVESNLDIIGVDAKTVTGMPSKSHDFWYQHPWISSDVLVQFVFHTEPEQRGLLKNHNENGLRYWTFPPDYPERIINIIRQVKKERTQIP